MRPKKIGKPKQTNILEEESLKLKEKLQLLRQQVNKKKIEKQMSKTTQANTGDGLSKFLKPNLKNQTQYPTKDKKLSNVLCEMKLQNVEQKLLQKGVSNYNAFLALEQAQIDQWKDILVGYRIRMKKFIKANKSQLQFQESPIQSKKQSTASSNKKQQKNIEDIIKNRQHNRIFVPLVREIQQSQQEQGTQYMTEDDEDIIIKSFMHIFKPRKGILKNNNKNGRQSLKVKWSQEVQKMQAEFKLKKHIKYPKQSIRRQALKELKYNQSQRSQYCWKCIKKVQKAVISHQKRIFCSQQCCQQYQQEIFMNQKMLQEPSVKSFKQLQQKIHIEEQSRQKEEIQDIQVVDLSIL